MQLKEIAGDFDYEFFFPGVAAGTAVEIPMLIMPTNALITSVKWVPSAAITANVTNYATLSFRNRAANGAGAAIPASRAYSATNSAAQTAEAMTLSGTATDLQPALGDVLTLAVAHSGTGLLIPPGLVQLKARVR